MAFSDRPFHQRFAEMGDMAEGIFERWARDNNISFVHYGLNRPPFNLFKALPAYIRVTPDYLCEYEKKLNKIKHMFVECKGCGLDLKIKQETLDHMQAWDDHLPLYFFVYNSRQHACALLSFEDLIALCKKSPKKQFENDKKEYYQIHVSTIEWTMLPPSYKEKSNE